MKPLTIALLAAGLTLGSTVAMAQPQGGQPQQACGKGQQAQCGQQGPDKGHQQQQGNQQQPGKQAPGQQQPDRQQGHAQDKTPPKQQPQHQNQQQQAKAPPQPAKPAPAHYNPGQKISGPAPMVRDPGRYGLVPTGRYVTQGDYVYRIDPDTQKVLNLVGAIADILN